MQLFMKFLNSMEYNVFSKVLKHINKFGLIYMRGLLKQNRKSAL